jgi:hypothetical protein
MRTEDVPPSGKEILLVSAEYIGHFRPMLAHLSLGL